MASFKAKFPVLQELFAKNHRGGPFGPPPAGRGLNFLSMGRNIFDILFDWSEQNTYSDTQSLIVIGLLTQVLMHHISD